MIDIICDSRVIDVTKSYLKIRCKNLAKHAYLDSVTGEVIYRCQDHAILHTYEPHAFIIRYENITFEEAALYEVMDG